MHVASSKCFFLADHCLQDFFRQVSVAGIFLGIAIPPPVISNGPSLILVSNSVENIIVIVVNFHL